MQVSLNSILWNITLIYVNLCLSYYSFNKIIDWIIYLIQCIQVDVINYIIDVNPFSGPNSNSNSFKHNRINRDLRRTPTRKIPFKHILLITTIQTISWNSWFRWSYSRIPIINHPIVKRYIINDRPLGSVLPCSDS